MPLLGLRNLEVSFPGPTGELRAVRGISMDAPAAEITCIVGESGCGKSLTCRAVLRLTPDNAILRGSILFRDRDILTLPERELRAIRGAAIGMIFQEPMTSLNPVLTVGEQTAEPLRRHLGLSRKEAKAKVIGLFAQVGIPAPESRYGDYPHQLSGGMRQRVMIAMALACKPDLLLADEPTTALDATIQGQILRLILRESEERGMAVLLITHDLGVVADVAHNVAVMYAGIIVEAGRARDLFTQPLHPYAQGLIASSPSRASFGLRRLPAIEGAVPSLENMPPGCPFAPRCSRVMPVCNQRVPPAREVDSQRVLCWLYA